MLLFGYPSPRRAERDYYPAVVMNFILGGGGFASRLTQEVREGKGYTYGVRSAFRGGAYDGGFQISSPVRANVTLEAATLIRDIVRDYGKTFTAQDLEVTKSFLSKSNARAFETPAAKLKILAAIGDFGLPRDYLKSEAAVVSGMTVEKVQALAARYLRTDAMTYVVVGDAKTQAAGISGLGYGAPALVKDEVADK
jgi:zinc protease